MREAFINSLPPEHGSGVAFQNSIALIMHKSIKEALKDGEWKDDKYLKSAKVLSESSLPDPEPELDFTPEALFKEIGEEFVNNEFSDLVYGCLFPVSVLPD